MQLKDAKSFLQKLNLYPKTAGNLPVQNTVQNIVNSFKDNLGKTKQFTYQVHTSFDNGIQRVKDTPLKQYFLPTAIPLKNYFLPTAITTPRVKAQVATAGRILQKFPDTTINFKQPAIKPVGVGNFSPINAIPFVSSMPGQMIRDYGKTAEKYGTGKKFDIRDLANISDFIPGLGFIGAAGVKPIAKETMEDLSGKLAKQTLEEASKNGYKRGMLDLLQRKASYLMGVDIKNPTGNWKADYYNTKSLLSDSSLESMGAPEAVVKEIKSLRDAIDELQALNKVKKVPEVVTDVKEVAKSRLNNLFNYSNELLKRGFDNQDIERIGVKKAKDIIEKNITPDIWRQANPIKKVVNKVKDWSNPQTVQEFENEMKRININVKDKVNALDYFRTPENVLKKIGLEDKARYLRRQWDTYTTTLPKEIERIKSWASQVPAESNQKIFKYLDGQGVELNPSEMKVANEIKDYLKVWADKLDLPKDSRITNYITHIFENDIKGKEFPQEVIEIIRKGNIPGQTYDPFLMKRFGIGGYVEDTWRALSAYVKRAERKYELDPALDSIKKVSEGLEESQYNYLKRYIDRVQMRPVEVETLLDNLIKSTPKVGYRFGQRPINTLSQTTRQWTYRGLLGLNPGSALKNLTQGANTYAELGEKYTLKGYTKVIQNFKSLLSGTDNELYKVGVLRDEFIQDKTLPVFKNTLQKLDSGLFYLFELAEKINRGASYWGAKAKYLNEGLSEALAIEKAKEVVRKTQFTFGRIDTPVALQSDIVKTFTQFQTYNLKQLEYLGGKIAKKEWAGLARYVGSTLFMALTVGKALGWEIKDLLPSARIGTPPTLQLPLEVGKAVVNAPDRYGRPRSFTKKLQDVLNAGVPYIPAGGQIRKSYQGIKSYVQGASTGATGKVKFEVEQNIPNLLKSALLGQYATPEGRKYINNMGKSKGQVIYEELKRLKPQEAALKAKQLDKDSLKALINYKNDINLKMTASEKNIRNQAVKDGTRAKSIVRLLNRTKQPQKKAELYSRYRKLGIITDDIAKQLMAARKAGVLK